ncbi:MAG: condensation domain-containing protein, partial [Rhodospirillaceae bacterium]
SRLVLTRPDRPEGESGRSFREVRDVFEADLSARAEAFARANRLTLNTLIQGVTALVIHRLTGLRDLCLGTVVAGRPPECPGAEETVGLFINTLPARFKLPGTAPVLGWLREVQTAHQAREAHGHAAIVDIRAWSELPPGTAPYDVLLAFENYPVEDALSGVSADGVVPFAPESVDVSVEEVNDPVSIQVIPGDQIAIKVSYDGALYLDNEIAALPGYLAHMLEGILETPDASLDEIAMLDAATSRTLLREPNRTFLAYDPTRPLHRMVEAQVAQTPAAIASECRGEQLRYDELNAGANALAAQIAALGIGPDQRVAVFVDRCAGLPMALIGVLKSGAAYVPLDPIFPPDRLALMLSDDGGAKAIVTRRCDE